MDVVACKVIAQLPHHLEVGIRQPYKPTYSASNMGFEKSYRFNQSQLEWRQLQQKEAVTN
jgi:hypothetical protein